MEIKIEGVIEKSGPKCWTVWVEVVSPEVDRPRTSGWDVHDLRLARRLKKAIEAQAAAVPGEEISTDVNGSTFIHCAHRVRGRCLNADLRSIGF
jgi:hypothetical protein